MATTYNTVPDEDRLKSAINVLDSLIAFYQHERMWVYRTRAILQEAFPNTDSTTQSPSLPPIEAPINEPLTSNQTRWMRRKKGFKLRLDGIRPRRVISVDQSRQPGYLHRREQLLEIFEKMMESRVESCQRISKLIRDANRADLYYR